MGTSWNCNERSLSFTTLPRFASGGVPYCCGVGVDHDPPQGSGGAFLREHFSGNRAVDTGPNSLQNFPVITNVFGFGSSTTIRGMLMSSPNRSFLIDIYRNASADVSGYGEGQNYVGSTSLAVDA